MLIFVSFRSILCELLLALLLPLIGILCELLLALIWLLFPSQTELKVIGHHHTYVRHKLYKSSDILSDGPVKDILRPACYKTSSVSMSSIYRVYQSAGENGIKTVYDDLRRQF